MTQTKRDTLVLQLGDWAWGNASTSCTYCLHETRKGGQVAPRDVVPVEEEEEEEEEEVLLMSFITLSL
jgi:hypothetical protein